LDAILHRKSQEQAISPQPSAIKKTRQFGGAYLAGKGCDADLDSDHAELLFLMADGRWLNKKAP
jgi:hypothetical protein